MQQYRKKPIVVLAEQFMGVPMEGVEWREPTHQPCVTTKQGQQVRIGLCEWVIKEADGSGYYPCAAETFTNTYEPA